MTALAATLPRTPRPAVDRIEAVFVILSDPLRRRILTILEGTGLSVVELVARLERRQQAVSHHLTIMKLCGIVEFAREGKRNRYRLTPLGRLAIRSLRITEDGIPGV